MKALRSTPKWLKKRGSDKGMEGKQCAPCRKPGTRKRPGGLATRAGQAHRVHTLISAERFVTVKVRVHGHQDDVRVL